MERNTITTIGKLEVGDRFVFIKRPDDVWEVIQQLPKYTVINQTLGNGNKVHKYDDMKKHAIQVKFMRHTEPKTNT